MLLFCLEKYNLCVIRSMFARFTTIYSRDSCMHFLFSSLPLLSIYSKVRNIFSTRFFEFELWNTLSVHWTRKERNAGVFPWIFQSRYKRGWFGELGIILGPNSTTILLRVWVSLTYKRFNYEGSLTNNQLALTGVNSTFDSTGGDDLRTMLPHRCIRSRDYTASVNWDEIFVLLFWKNNNRNLNLEIRSFESWKTLLTFETLKFPIYIYVCSIRVKFKLYIYIFEFKLDRFNQEGLIYYFGGS